MKKLSGILAMLVLLFSTACTDKTNEVKKEKVVVEKEAPRKTSVDLNTNGVKVQTKKVDVSVGTGNK